MIDLRKYFLDNVVEDDYYWRFRPLAEGANTRWNVFNGPAEVLGDERCYFEVFDEEEAIERFRFICRPENEPAGSEAECLFYVVAYYLRNLGYVIEEFPRVLERPPAKPLDFVYGEIRQKAFADGLNDGGTVAYATRRQIVHDMTFAKKSSTIEAGDELNRRIQMISSRGATFDEMVIDEKLEMLANLIESLLKIDGKFVSVDCDTAMLGFVDCDDVKNYRGTLQCFRHSSDKAIAERARFTEAQKTFLVDFGMTVCRALAPLVQR